MWTLECDSDLFQNKKRWLKPGKNYLFGRTRSEHPNDGVKIDQTYEISNRSVSRKHLVISVEPVEPGQESNVFAKSKLVLTDESKIGTYLDNERFVKESRTLQNNEHSFRLGSYDVNFKIRWSPVVFAFSFTDKQQKTTTDVLQPFRSRLGPLDIKVLMPYIIDSTTHVMSGKRNIAKSLQALINGKHVVTEKFIDALVEVASSSGVWDDGETPLPSPLEEDIIGSWPDEMSFVPPTGNEPVKRPSELFKPDPSRITLFEGLTFIFADENQFSNLQPVVTNGGAKALLYPLKLGETTLDDFVKYVREVAEKKGLDCGDLSRSDKAVVVVRFRGKGETEQWALQFLHDLDARLEQRSMEQNEFLDAILTLDTAPLRRPLEEVYEDEIGNIRSITSNSDDEATPAGHVQVTSSAPQPSNGMSRPESSRSRPRRAALKSRFEGFDTFDIAELPTRPTPSSPPAESAPNGRNEDSSGMFVQDSNPIPEDPSPGPQTRSRKRSPPAPDESADPLDALFPAAARMKKRRLEGKLQANNQSKSPTPQPEPLTASLIKKEKEPIDVRSAARSHAEALDKTRDEDRQGSTEPGQLEDEEITKLKDLVVIEEMEVKPRERPRRPLSSADDQENDPRWDPAWNGRRNFKAFRSNKVRDAGNDENGIIRRVRKVFVPLEEVKHKDYGIGDSYWLGESSNSTQRSKSRRPDGTTTSQSQSHNPTTSESQTQQSRLSRDSAAVHRQRQPSEPLFINDDDDFDDAAADFREILPEEIAGDPREASVIASSMRSHRRSQSKDQPTQQERRNGKRLATSPAQSASASPAKRTRQTRIAPSSSARVARELEEKNDELKFKFRRKR